ncbi:MAG: peptidoglycan D,D-transpeptidase FtsI family protein, partial [Marinirhabdus sp.]
QVYNTSFGKLSEMNAIKVEFEYPQRGYIYDRHGKLLVSNQPSYDVMVVPREVKNLDTLEFCELLKLPKENFNEILKKARGYSPRLPSVVVPQLTKAEYARLSEKMYKFRGFYIQKRQLRDYQINHSANVLGFIAEANKGTIDKNPYYQMGDLLGMQGAEKQYEAVLRGVKGVKYIQKDRFNREIGPYKEGVFDTLPKRGHDIVLTIDEALQKYGESLMVNKRGGIVAIEPATGEILALVAAPNYDPGLLVGRQRSANYTKLHYDSIAKPLYDRVLSGEYPPGSPFKALTGLIGLQENVITPTERVHCAHGYVYGRGRTLRCHSHASPLALQPGIANSCNAYFCTVYRRIIEKFPTPQEGMDNWHRHLESFGLDQYLGYDLPSGRRGLIPDSKYYDRMYGPKKRWYANT